MRIRKARKEDFPRLVRLARTCGLDYAGMEADDFWVAGEGDLVLGLCALKKHPDCLELCALGVGEKWRGRGWGDRLARTVIRNANGTLFLATVIPAFFARLGFKTAKDVPASMIKNAEWCTGCTPELCTVMVWQGKR